MQNSNEMFNNLAFALKAAATEVENIGQFTEQQRALLNQALYEIQNLQDYISKDRNTKDKMLKILKEELYGEDGIE